MAYTVPGILIYLVNNLFRIYIIAMLLRVFFDAAAERRVLILRAVCYAAYYVVNSMGFLIFNFPPFMNLTVNIFGVVLVTWTYSGSWKYRICAMLIALGITSIAENMVYRVLVLISVENIISIGLSVTNLLTFMIAMILQKCMELKQGDHVELTEWISVIIIPGASIMFSTLVVEGSDNIILILIGDTCLILFNIFVFYLFDRIIKLHKVKLEMELLEQQNNAYQKQVRMLQQLDENLSIVRHDMKNHLLVLQKMAEDKEPGELQTYLEKLLPSLEGTGRFVATGNAAIDSLVNYKLSEITEDADVDIKTEVSVSRQIGIDETDLSIIFGNLLDNAARALKTCSVEKHLLLTIKEERKILYIKIENTHTEKLKRTNNLFKSTKNDSSVHGWGLKSIQRIVEKNNGEISMNDTENLFSVEIMLYTC